MPIIIPPEKWYELRRKCDKAYRQHYFKKPFDIPVFTWGTPSGCTWSTPSGCKDDE